MRCEVKALMAAVELERLVDKPTLAVVATLRSKDDEKRFNDILSESLRLVDVDGFGRESGTDAELRSFFAKTSSA